MASHKSMLRSFAQMSDARLREFIASQEEIERRCKNPTKANKTTHDLYTRWAKEELARRPAQAGVEGDQ